MQGGKRRRRRHSESIRGKITDGQNRGMLIRKEGRGRRAKKRNMMMKCSRRVGVEEIIGNHHRRERGIGINLSMNWNHK